MLAAVVAILVLAMLVAAGVLVARRTLVATRPDAGVPAPLVGTAAEVVVPVAPPPAPAIVRRAARPAVVLVHGLFGFDTLGVGPARVAYFRGVERRIAERGADVTIVRLPPLAGVPARALALMAQLDGVDSDRLTLVAHSLGGLDARYALARNRALADRVEALVTIGTPHRGTPIADLFASGPTDRLRALLARIGLSTDAVDWLTTARLEQFNREVPDAAGVRYASVVAATDDRARVHALLRVTHTMLRRYGASDGLVPAWSQPWGEVVASCEADHWAQIGWAKGPAGHDAAALVERALDGVRCLPPARLPRLLTA